MIPSNLNCEVKIIDDTLPLMSLNDSDRGRKALTCFFEFVVVSVQLDTCVCVRRVFGVIAVNA